MSLVLYFSAYFIVYSAVLIFSRAVFRAGVPSWVPTAFCIFLAVAMMGLILFTVPSSRHGSWTVPALFLLVFVYLVFVLLALVAPLPPRQTAIEAENSQDMEIARVADPGEDITMVKGISDSGSVYGISCVKETALTIARPSERSVTVVPITAAQQFNWENLCVTPSGEIHAFGESRDDRGRLVLCYTRRAPTGGLLASRFWFDQRQASLVRTPSRAFLLAEGEIIDPLTHRVVARLPSDSRSNFAVGDGAGNWLFQRGAGADLFAEDTKRGLAVLTAGGEVVDLWFRVPVLNVGEAVLAGGRAYILRRRTIIEVLVPETAGGLQAGSFRVVAEGVRSSLFPSEEHLFLFQKGKTWFVYGEGRGPGQAELARPHSEKRAIRNLQLHLLDAHYRPPLAPDDLGGKGYQAARGDFKSAASKVS